MLWARLSLRAQAAIAVVVPCLAVALFSAIYFPSRLNAQAAQALESQARAVAQLAVSNAVPTMRLVRDGLATPEDLKPTFEGVRASGTITHVGAVVVPEGASSVQLSEGSSAQVAGNLPVGVYAVPPTGSCDVTQGAMLEVRCTAKDQDYTGLVVTHISLATFSEQARRNQIVGLWVLFAALALGLALAFWSSAAIVGPLGTVSRVVRDVAAGDVRVAKIPVAGTNEVQSMAGSVNDMVESLRGLLSEMVQLTSRLAGAAKGLTAASHDQEHVTSQQSAYAQQIAATFEELSRTAESITRSTEVVEQSAGRTNEAVDDAKATVADMVREMSEIRKETNEMADAMTRLNGEVQQVSRIAGVIKQVADRSDLLALNAALEGTKAGEVGRGFSVVAAEMRKLAESVAQSARDIGRIVESVQQSGDRAVQLARQGVSASDRGMRVAERASVSFTQIVELARGTKEAAQQIAVATRQQRESSEQAVTGARNVADLVSRGVDATGRTTRIAKDLETSVDALTGVTARFKIDRAG